MSGTVIAGLDAPRCGHSLAWGMLSWVISGKPPFFKSSHIQEGAKELIEVGLLQRASPPYGLLPHSTVVVGIGNKHGSAHECHATTHGLPLLQTL